jgi:serine-type D-Ala-D-Ala carboxypeptidase/endopeptidase (penicillin-binding protein 4)
MKFDMRTVVQKRYFAAIMIVMLTLCVTAVRGQNGSQIPAPVAEVFTKAQVPLDNVSLLVKEIGARDAIVSHNADRTMNPASVMKLVTTYAGLELLGPAYAWKTEVLSAGELRGSTLHGDLVLRGTGDPKLTVERFWLLLKQLRERGLRNITGDLILDKSVFAVVEADPAKFDGEPLRAHNVSPDALLLNFKAVRFQFAPAFDGKNVSISPDIKPAQLDIINRARLVEAPCGEWRERIKLDVQTPSPTKLRVTFTGSYPRSCGERSWNVSLLDHARFVGGVFASMWGDVGGVWNGAVRIAQAPADAKLILSSESPALSDVIRDINKYSNNVMARQLYLTLSAETDKQPATTARSFDLVRAWLARKNIAAPELVIENGSGLSRIERISAASLARILDAAWRSAVMPEFISSLSMVGVDGTFRRRVRGEVVTGQAHMKSGTLNDVRAIAGYVLAADERRYIVIMMVNHNNAVLTQSAQDQLLQWVYARALPALPPIPPQ